MNRSSALTRSSSIRTHLSWCPTAAAIRFFQTRARTRAAFACDPCGGVELIPLPGPTDELHAVALAFVKGVVRVLAGAAERARDQDDVAMMQALAEAAR